MAHSPSNPNSGRPRRSRPLRARLKALWPQGPLAAVLALIGLLNLLDGLHLPLTVLQRMRTLDGLAESLAALGGTAQVVLGLLLIVAGAGLLRRLVSAWTLAALLMVIAVGVNVVQSRWGPSLVVQGTLLTVLLWSKRHFTQQTVLASVVFSLTGIFAILAYGAIGSLLLGKGFKPEIHDLGTACYYTVVTLSTVGYGDIVPISPEARWFVISLLVIGLGVFASAIASVLGPKISSELQRLFNPKATSMNRKNHVILVGEGSLARNTALELKQRGLAFVQIVSAGGAAATDHPVIEGDATSDDILRQAGIKDARLVIAAREDDGENALIALVAKDLNPQARLLAVASSALSIRRLKLARADQVFSPSAVGSRMLADLVEGQPVAAAFQDLVED
ncbi:MAG: NAD-binding protein, partial [Opitutales bacterium]